MKNISDYSNNKKNIIITNNENKILKDIYKILKNIEKQINEINIYIKKDKDKNKYNILNSLDEKYNYNNKNISIKEIKNQSLNINNQLNEIIKTINKELVINNTQNTKNNIIILNKLIPELTDEFFIEPKQKNKEFITSHHLITKPLICQFIIKIFIPGVKKEENIQEGERMDELLRILIPIPDNVIEEINSIEILPEEKKSLNIEYKDELKNKL